MKFFLFLVALIPAALCKSQTVSPSIIATAGDVNKAAGISLEWTLGEPVIESLSTADRFYTQGFHQPVLMARNFQVNKEQLLTGYKVTVAPNPVQSLLTATIHSPKEENMLLTLIDFTGRRYGVQTVTGKSGLATLRITESDAD